MGAALTVETVDHLQVVEGVEYGQRVCADEQKRGWREFP